MTLRRQQQLVLGPEVVLHEAHRHAGLGGDLPERRGGEAALERDAHHGVGDLAPPLSMVHSLRHRVSWYTRTMKRGRTRPDGAARRRRRDSGRSRTSSGPSTPVGRSRSMSRRRTGRPAPTGGPGAGDPIVFLHGIGGTSLLWASYAEQLTGQRRLVDRHRRRRRSQRAASSLRRTRRPRHRTRERTRGAGPSGRDARRSFPRWLARPQSARHVGPHASRPRSCSIRSASLRCTCCASCSGGFPSCSARTRPNARGFSIGEATPHATPRGQARDPTRAPRPDQPPAPDPPPAPVQRRRAPFDHGIRRGARRRTNRTVRRERTHEPRPTLIPRATVALVPDAGHAFPVDHVDLVLSYVHQVTGTTT